MEQVKAIVDAMDFVKGFETRYKINRQGEVWSLYQSKFMTPQLNEDGYLELYCVDADGNRHRMRIHRLLGLQYHPNPDNLPEIDHIDRNRQNNSLDNLRWVSRVENRANREDQTPEAKAKAEQAHIEYKTEWAKQNRLNKRVPTRVLYENPDDAPSRSAEYKREMTRKYRAEMSAEEKESILKKRRETSKTDTALQKNRDYLNDPEVKARRKQQQQEKRATMTEEQKKAQSDRRKELYNAKKKAKD